MGKEAEPDLTQLLVAWSGGDKQAMDRLVPLVYRELRRVAHRMLAGEQKGQDLQTSALVNEAYLKLIDVDRVQWKSRTHFFALAAQLMRRILVDDARRRKNQKRGGGFRHVSFEERLVVSPAMSSEVIALDEALKALESLDVRKVRVVELKFFAGLNVRETAQALEVSPETVQRDWQWAKAWLRREIEKAGHEPAQPA